MTSPTYPPTYENEKPLYFNVPSLQVRSCYCIQLRAFLNPVCCSGQMVCQLKTQVGSCRHCKEEIRKRRGAEVFGEQGEYDKKEESGIKYSVGQ